MYMYIISNIKYLLFWVKVWIARKTTNSSNSIFGWSFSSSYFVKKPNCFLTNFCFIYCLIIPEIMEIYFSIIVHFQIFWITFTKFYEFICLCKGNMSDLQNYKSCIPDKFFHTLIFFLYEPYWPMTCIKSA